MVFDRIENWRNTFAGPVWREVFEHIASLGPGAEDGFTDLKAEGMFARVMSYETRGPDEGILESHRNFIDVQAALVEAEGLEWYPSDSLKVKQPYDAEKDVALYHRPETAPARVDIDTGMFAVLYPEDAHMAQQIVGGERRMMKKVVVKVPVGLVLPKEAE